MPREERFRQGLRDFGYVEAQQFRLEPRYAEGLPARLAALAAELVQLPVDLLVATGGPTAPAAHAATRTIPHRDAVRARPG